MSLIIPAKFKHDFRDWTSFHSEGSHRCDPAKCVKPSNLTNEKGHCNQQWASNGRAMWNSSCVHTFPTTFCEQPLKQLNVLNTSDLRWVREPFEISLSYYWSNKLICMDMLLNTRNIIQEMFSKTQPCRAPSSNSTCAVSAEHPWGSQKRQAQCGMEIMVKAPALSWKPSWARGENWDLCQYRQDKR